VVHALRAVLRAGAGERQVVLIFDGLEHLDEPSLEAFVELVTRPAAKELTIGFTTLETPPERLAQSALVELPRLEPADLARLVQGLSGATAGPRLLAHLGQYGQGLPSMLHDWLALLEERGALKVSEGTVELIDAVPALPEPESAAALTAARLELAPLESARGLEAAWCLGETFEPAAVVTAWPKATPQSLQLAAGAKLLLPAAGRRWCFSSPRLYAAVEQRPSRERAAMHHRLALALVEQGKANAASVSPLEVGRHLLLAGDGGRAAALFQHAAEQAVARRAPRDAVPALKGLADALGLGAPLPVQRRVEALARAAALSLASQDAARARGFVDEGLRLAAAASFSSAELTLGLARVLRSEARRARAAEALAQAQALSEGSVLRSLVDVERAETLEQEGDVLGAMVAFEAALLGAPAASALACWHGEVDLTARIEARLAALSLQTRDVDAARRLFESSALRWRASGYAPGEARAFSNWGAVCAVAKDLPTAAQCYAAAADAAARSGDFLFQARALLQQARVLKKLDPASPLIPATAGEARRLAVALGWEQGREDASALVK
jgi:tetratricopeptide (TPR) repeat protein